MEPSRSPGRTRKTSLGLGTSYGEREKATARTPSSLAGTDRSGDGRGTGSMPSSSSRASRYNAASSSITSASGMAAVRRAHHILGGDDRLIFDLGARVTKVGHCGEARPRAILWSLQHATPIEQIIDAECRGLLYSLDIARCRNDTERKITVYRLKARLKCLLRKLIHHTLTQDAKQRKCVIVENPFMPTLIKDLIREILFDNLQVSSVSFVPSHLMSAVAVGRPSALVLDIGYEQSTLTPIHFWRPLTTHGYMNTSPRAAKSLSQRLRALLLHHGSYVTMPSNGQASASLTSFAYLQASSSVVKRTKIPPDLLDDDFLDDIKSKALFVASTPPKDPDLTSRIPNWSSSAVPGSAERISNTHETEEEEDERWMGVLQARYKVDCQTKDLLLEVPPLHASPLAPPSQPATLGTSPTMSRPNRGAILVPGWVRERAAEVLFEQGDDDAPSLAEMVLSALLRLPVDVRPWLASNIYVVGGTAMLPGLAHRLRLELVRTLVAAERFSAPSEPTLLALTQPTVGYIPRRRALQPIQVATQSQGADVRKEERDEEKGSVDTGAPDESFVSAVAGEESFVTTDEADTTAAEADKPRAESSASSLRHTVVQREPIIKYTPLAPLIEMIAVVNDHAPRLNVEGQPVSGHAPSFPVNLSAWIGASLMGSLRVDSVDQMHREEWDELIRRRQAALSQQRNEKKDGKSANERPAMGLGRGSFLGTVGGLDLGTYGPLSAGAMSKFAASPASPTPGGGGGGGSGGLRSPPPPTSKATS